MLTAYVHCSVCQRAFDAGLGLACPSCRPPRPQVEVARADAADAADALARMLRDASATERAAMWATVTATLGELAPPPVALVVDRAPQPEPKSRRSGLELGLGLVVRVFDVVGRSVRAGQSAAVRVRSLVGSSVGELRSMRRSTARS